MAREFDNVLDDCIGRLARGESLADCLTRYPEHAETLEPHLRMAARLDTAFAMAISPAAKERGRHLLQTEMRALASRNGAGNPSRFSFSSLLMGHVRVAAATAVIMLALLFGSGGAVAASGSALPGDLLYPVKRASEQVRLTLQVTDEGKARMHLSLAERRVQEISGLLEGGNTARWGATRQDLQGHLAAAARITGFLTGQRVGGDLRMELEASASQYLALLQAQLPTVPAEQRGVATDAFQAASEAYGRAVETVVAQAPASPPGTTPGVLHVRATETSGAYLSTGGSSGRILAAPDPSAPASLASFPPGVDNIVITVEDIEARRAVSKEGRWLSIAEGPLTLDLLRMSGVQKFLGEQPVEPGVYTQVRFRITSVTVVVAGGVERQVDPPGGHVSLTRPFQVAEDGQTVVLLEFDARRSIRSSGQDQFVVTPQVSVLAHEPGRVLDQGRGNSGRNRGKGSRGEGPQHEAVTQVQTEFEGRVEEVTSDSVVIAGQRITVGPEVAEAVTLGSIVEVEARPQPDGSFVATRVDTERKGHKGKSKDDKDPDVEVKIEGVLDVQTSGGWVVDGHRVRITADTEIEGALGDGVRVRVEGILQPNGEVIAKEVRAESDGGGGGGGGSGNGGAGNSGPGKKEGARLEGSIDAVDTTQLTVDGQVVVIDASTKVEGTLEPGLQVEVEVVTQPDGTLLAVSIEVADHEETVDDDEGDGDNEGKGGKGNGENGKNGKGDKGEGDEGDKGGKGKGKSGKDREGKSDDDATPTPTVQPTPTPTPVASPVPIPSVTPTPLTSPTATSSPTSSSSRKKIRIEGLIESIDGATWRVAGYVVVIDSETKIKGTPGIGLEARVEGIEREDGAILASKIDVS